MSEINFRGIFAPIPTPFINGKIAYDELAANIEKWSKTGLKGLVAMGSNHAGIFRRRPPTAAFAQFGKGKIRNQRDAY